MEKYATYLDLLSREQEYLDRLLGMAGEKRQAILAGAADRITTLSNSEDSALDALTELRARRRAELSELYLQAGGSGRARGIVRERILEEAPERLRPALADSLRRYEDKLLRLRRESKINNILLSDRLLVLRETVEAVLASAQPKDVYQPPAPKDAKRRKKILAAPSLVVDQKV